MLRKNLRPTKQTYLVFFEGKTEESFFKILKSLFWSRENSNGFNKKKSLNGGSPIAQLNSIKKNKSPKISQVDKLLRITDKDEYDEEEIRKWLVNNSQIKQKLTIILFTPCVEGIILEIYNMKFDYNIINKQKLKNKCEQLCQSYCNENSMKKIITKETVDKYLNCGYKNTKQDYQIFGKLHSVIIE